MKILETRLYQHIDLLVLRYPQLAVTRDCIVEAYRILEEAYTHEGKLLVAGNGGSAADAEHIVGELMKGFVNPRKLETDYSDALITVNKELGRVLSENLQGALPAIALDGHLALTTAYMNDCEPLLCFAQQVNGFGRKSDVFIIRKSKFPQNPKRSVRFSGKRTKRSVQKRKARNTQKAETKVL